MRRRSFVRTAGIIGAALATRPFSSLLRAAEGPTNASVQSDSPIKLTPPKTGKIAVAFPISPGVTVIDFAGPWEVFQDVMVPERGPSMEDHVPFQLFTVAEKNGTIEGSGGLKLVPDFTFDDAPTPRLVVVPAQRGSPALHEWLRKVSKTTDLTMSVCTGAFQLGRAGLLDGKVATTHHDFFEDFENEFPRTKVRRDARFVEDGAISTAAGLSSGIDLALRVVERYFGRQIAERTAAYMEYQGKAWITQKP